MRLANGEPTFNPRNDGRRMTLSRLLLLSSLLSLPLTAQESPDKDTLAAIDQLVEQVMAEQKIPGVTVGIARDGKTILSKGYGFADLELEVPMRAEHIFRIGSITKQFTAAAIVRLIENGELDREAMLRDVLPEQAFEGHEITIEQLLHHTSGIKSYTGMGQAWQEVVRNPLPPAELIALVKTQPFDFPPGKGWAYNNTGYYLLGMIVEEVTGEPYDQYIQNEFFSPLEMSRSSYGWEQPIIKGRAEGYSLRDNQVVNDDFLYMGHPYAAGSLLSTVDDLITWTHALHDGRVVDSDSYQLMITPVQTSRGSAGYGYGLMISKLGEHPRIAHGGGIFGFSTQLSYYPEQKLCVAVLLNTDAVSAGRLENRITRRLLGMPEPAAASSGR